MLKFDINKTKYKKIHFIGIGGISMSGLAEILLNRNYIVTGSDMNNSKIIKKLINDGATIHIGHNAKNIKDVDLIVYTSAIGEDNPEYIFAKENKIPMMDRATFLGELMKGYENSIGVAGTHGKTSTTGMISSILVNSPIESTILLGGELDSIGGNVKIGDNKLLLTEACEYKGNFLKFNPTIGIILNIDEDHLDYFTSMEHIKDTFKEFIDLIPDSGYVILNADDEHVKNIIDNNKKNIITFGLSKENDYHATNIKYNDKGYGEYDLYINNKFVDHIKLNVVGEHNIYNSLSAIAATFISGVDMESIKEGLKIYKGTHRRFEDKGVVKGIQIIDDYAHHPTEIKATLNSIGDKYNKIYCVFQPHTYTRTKSLLKEFGTCFNGADKIIITDIYAAREKNTGIVNSKQLVDEINHNGQDSIFIETFDEVVNFLEKTVDKGDLIITIGAGDVYKVGDMFKTKINK